MSEGAQVVRFFALLGALLLPSCMTPVHTEPATVEGKPGHEVECSEVEERCQQIERLLCPAGHALVTREEAPQRAPGREARLVFRHTIVCRPLPSPSLVPPAPPDEQRPPEGGYRPYYY